MARRSSQCRTHSETEGPLLIRLSHRRKCIQRNSQEIATVCYDMGVTEFHMSDNAARFGFVNFAETWNGRLAMLGFVIGLGTELLTGQGILTQVGLG